MLGRALVSRKETAPQSARNAPAAAIATPSVPALVSGIRDLLISFASQAQGDTDARRLLEIYVEATKHVHRVVAEEAVQSLRFDNPRNPYRPSPQDVYERCKKIDRDWCEQTWRYFLKGHPWPSDWRAPPLTQGCRLPDVLVKRYLARRLELLNWEVAHTGCPDQLAQLSANQLAKIPEDCFAEGQKARATAAIGEREMAFRRAEEQLKPDRRMAEEGDPLSGLDSAASTRPAQPITFVR
jgi:hypothetical protein